MTASNLKAEQEISQTWSLSELRELPAPVAFNTLDLSSDFILVSF